MISGATSGIDGFRVDACGHSSNTRALVCRRPHFCTARTLSDVASRLPSPPAASRCRPPLSIADGRWQQSTAAAVLHSRSLVVAAAATRPRATCRHYHPQNRRARVIRISVAAASTTLERAVRVAATSTSVETPCFLLRRRLWRQRRASRGPCNRPSSRLCFNRFNVTIRAACVSLES